MNTKEQNKMSKIELQTFSPIINTVPTEVFPMLMFPSNSPYLEKLIMENYINIRAFDTMAPDSDGFVLRFDQYEIPELYGIFDVLRIPRDLIHGTNDVIYLLKSFLKAGYLLLCEYDSYYITRFQQKTHRSHKIIISGYNDKIDSFSCYEFSERRVIRLWIEYKEISAAISQYGFQNIQSGGILGLRVKNDLKTNINYQKTLEGFGKLISDSHFDISAGIVVTGGNAFRVFAEGILTYKENEERLYRALYLTNYLRESEKLLQYRIEFLNRKEHIDIDAIQNELMSSSHLVSKIFFRLLKIEKTHSESRFDSKKEIEDIMTAINSYIETSKSFYRLVLSIIERNEQDSKLDIYKNSRRYIRR